MQNLALLNQIVKTNLFVKTKKTMSSIIRQKRIIKKIKSEFEPIIFKNFTIKIAESNFEIKKAQSLRYKTFFKEKKIKKNFFKFLLQRDYDFYDKISDHLIIIDNNRGIRDNVIGTYRLLRGNCAKLYRGFYTEQEFDISNLKKNFSSKDILELGRSCVHPQYRSGIILKLLWQGISNYIKMYKIKINFKNEIKNGNFIKKLIRQTKIIIGCHDVSEGGICLAISELCIRSKMGVEIKIPKNYNNPVKWLFGEDQGRYIVEINEINVKKVSEILNNNSVHYDELGYVDEKMLSFESDIKLPIEELSNAHKYWLKRYMDN